MYSKNSTKIFESEEHSKRVADALDRRLYPRTALREEVLADVVGVSPETIRNWRRRRSDPSSYRFGKLMQVFTAMGDMAFWADVYGPIGEQMRQRFVQKERERAAQAEQERRHLELLNGSMEE